MLEYEGEAVIYNYPRRLYSQHCDPCGKLICYTSNRYVDGDYVLCPECGAKLIGVKNV